MWTVVDMLKWLPVLLLAFWDKVASCSLCLCFNSAVFVGNTESLSSSMICTRIMLLGRCAARFVVSITLNPRPCAFDRGSVVAVAFFSWRSFKSPTIRNCPLQPNASSSTIRRQIACNPCIPIDLIRTIKQLCNGVWIVSVRCVCSLLQSIETAGTIDTKQN